MSKTSWSIIILVIVAAAVVFWGWRYGGWFSAARPGGGEFDSAKQEKINQQLQADIELRREVEDAKIALQAYSSDQGKLPAQLAGLVPDYLPEVPAHVKYDRFSDLTAVVSAPLSEQHSALMADDDGADNTRYELKIEIVKSE